MSWTRSSWVGWFWKLTSMPYCKPYAIRTTSTTILCGPEQPDKVGAWIRYEKAWVPGAVASGKAIRQRNYMKFCLKLLLPPLRSPTRRVLSYPRQLIAIISDQSQKVDKDVNDVQIDRHCAVHIVLLVHLIFGVLSANNEASIVSQEERKQGRAEEAVYPLAEWKEPLWQDSEPFEKVDKTINDEYGQQRKDALAPLAQIVLGVVVHHLKRGGDNGGK
mmetsp:Transcript_11782/g.19617  ORF Transcript_11782/g.19617 Transcript_11782/m.19617 type:complete len:218 (+) Transcript_11782:696-1349(+)